MSNSYLKTLHTNLRKIATTDQKEEIRFVMELFLNGVNLLSKDEKADLFQEDEAYKFSDNRRIDRVINHVNFASKLSHVLHNLSSLLLTTIHLQLHLSRNPSTEYYIRTFVTDKNSVTRIVTGSQLAELDIGEDERTRYTKVSNILIVQFRRYVQRLISNVTPKLASYIAKNVFLAPKSLSYSETEVKLVRYEDGFIRTCFENIPETFVADVSEKLVEEYFKESWLKSKKTGDKYSIGEYTEKNLKYIMAKTVKANKESSDLRSVFATFIASVQTLSTKFDLSEIETAVQNGVKVEDAVPAINTLSMLFDSLDTLEKYSFISFVAKCSLDLGCNEYLCYIDTLNHVKHGEKTLRETLGKKIKKGASISYVPISRRSLKSAISAIKQSDVASDRAVASVFKSFGNVAGSSRKHVSAQFEDFIMRTKGQELNEKMRKSMESNMNKVRQLASDENDKALALVKKVAFIPRRNHFSTLECLESLRDEFDRVRTLNNQEARNEVLPGFIQTFCMITNGLYKTRPAEGSKKEEIVDDELQRQINIFALAAKISPKVETEPEREEVSKKSKNSKKTREVEEVRPSSPARVSRSSSPARSVSSPSRNVIRSDGSTAPKTGSGRPRAEDLEPDSDEDN